MVKRDGKLELKLAVAACVVLLPVAVPAQTETTIGHPPTKTAVLSSSRPTDSHGETVYEIRGRRRQDQPIVAGTFTAPVPLNRSFPEYPEGMRRKKQDGQVEVEGIVAQDGQFIDLKATNTSDPAFNENAIKAAARYMFQPATLDGKPVACLLRIEMTFTIH
jgi:TonB family protein